MTEIPESLLRRSAEAKANALGLPVEQVLAEMKGEAPPATPPPGSTSEPQEPVLDDGVEEVPPAAGPGVEEPIVEMTSEPVVTPEAPHEAPAPASEPPEPKPDEAAIEPLEEAFEESAADELDAVAPPILVEQTPAAAVETEETPAAVATIVEESPPAVEGNGAGNGKVAATVSPRPVVPPVGTPEGVRTQRLLTVVKARAIQTVKAEPTDKVNTWPHLMLMEFGALLAITGFLVILAVIIHSPLLDPANFNSTPNPSKAPWYFLGLQELLSYFDPQIAGVTVPTITGMIGFMAVPYVDKNPSTRPSDRKFAIALYSTFLAGAATLTIIGVLFRGRGFNFSYPWKDGVFFDDLKDWVQFE
jgi:hypothetical protein